MLVTHDLGVMSALADTVTVMRDGIVVEHGDRYQVIREPKSEYTRSLIDALPHVKPPAEILSVVEAEIEAETRDAEGDN